MKSAQFDPRLESVRGLAALMVAGAHAIVVYPTHDWANIATRAFRTFLNGDFAVSMFFVLSGLVLGMGLQRQGRGTCREYCAYAIRRVFRICPLLVISIVGILFFLLQLRNFSGPNFWFNLELGYRPTLLNINRIPNTVEIFKNLFLISSSMNLVAWTLGIEIISSLLLPLAHYARVRMPASGTLLILALAGLLALLSKWFLLLGWVKFEGVFNWSVLQFFYLFYLGYLLPILGPRCFARCKNSPVASSIVLIAVLGLIISTNWCPDPYRLYAGIGSWALLGVLLYGFDLKVFRCLEWPVVRFFGRISYSFYLLHDLVLIVMARVGAHYIFHGQQPAHPLLVNLMWVFFSIVVAACVASVAHRWVELPFIRAGKRLAARVASQKDQPTAPQPVSLPGANAPA